MSTPIEFNPNSNLENKNNNNKRKYLTKKQQQLLQQQQQQQQQPLQPQQQQPKPQRKQQRKQRQHPQNDSDPDENDDEDDDGSNNSGSESENDSKEEERILEELDLEYEKLQANNQAIRKESFCGVCEMNGTQIDCQGTCKQSFHLDCVGLLCETDSFKCDECLSSSHICFLCKKPSNQQDNSITRKCSSIQCGKYYHDECAKSNDIFRRESSKSTSYLCPLHTCLTCYAESKNHANAHRRLSGSGGGGGSAMIAATAASSTDSSSASNNNNNNNNNSIETSSSFILNASAQAAFKGRFMKCVRCPTAYHVGDHCMAAGSIILGGCNIICPNHFQPIRAITQHQRVNVTWCFVCCKGGDLVGCDYCPSAYHFNCLDKPPVNFLLNSNNKKKQENNSDAQSLKSEQSSPPHSESSSQQHSPTSTVSSSVGSHSNPIVLGWKCEDCLNGRRPLFGDIVWAKVGVYRWWPAQICHPRNLPPNLRDKVHQVGEFPVKFFGTNDYFWVSLGRCFAFAEGDECNKPAAQQKSLGLAYKNGVKHAIVAFKEVQRLKMMRLAKSVGRDALKVAKHNFIYIKTCKPYGNVSIPKILLCDLPRCDCSPKSACPCGTDDCMNRILKYECHPAICPAGERCQNQRFVKRQYPKQEPVYTGARGWGLRALVDIKKGEFVNEYVGELIDDEECKRRLELAHENDISNFYFLTIEKDRIIDAGPKGNLSRFMNHSCEPNLETQKWNVNGDIRVGLFALVDIPAETELTFNYNLDCLSNEKAPCRCGAKNCSGFIGVRPKNNNNNNNTNQNNNVNSPSLNALTTTNSTTAINSNIPNNRKRKLSENVKQTKAATQTAATVGSQKQNRKIANMRSSSVSSNPSNSDLKMKKTPKSEKPENNKPSKKSNKKTTGANNNNNNNNSNQPKAKL